MRWSSKNQLAGTVTFLSVSLTEEKKSGKLFDFVEIIFLGRICCFFLFLFQAENFYWSKRSLFLRLWILHFILAGEGSEKIYAINCDFHVVLVLFLSVCIFLKKYLEHFIVQSRKFVLLAFSKSSCAIEATDIIAFFSTSDEAISPQSCLLF